MAAVNNPLVRSVLIAGMHDGDNQFTRFAEDLWLKFEHMPEVRSYGHIPNKYDAVIIAAAIASHTMYQSVKSVYNQLGKPIFLSKNGVSEIREAFEMAVFGSVAVLKALRAEAGDGAVPITHRFWWVLANFKQPGDTIKIKEVQRFFDKFIIKGEDKALEMCWWRAGSNGFMTAMSPGVATFNGIPVAAFESLKKHGLECPKESVMREKSATAAIVVPPKKETFEFIQYQNPAPTVSHDSQASVELLLEAMQRSQDEVTKLTAMIEKTVPEIIQREMRGITTMLGSLVPKLNGLSPDQIEKVDQMLDLFLSMGKTR